jgi:hypothetical protein
MLPQVLGVMPHVPPLLPLEALRHRLFTVRLFTVRLFTVRLFTVRLFPACARARRPERVMVGLPGDTSLSPPTDIVVRIAPAAASRV